jgi:hypothetical protein
MDQKCTKVTAVRQGRTKKASTKKKSPSHRDPGLLWIVTPSEGALLGCLSTFVGYVSSDASGN